MCVYISTDKKGKGAHPTWYRPNSLSGGAPGCAPTTSTATKLLEHLTEQPQTISCIDFVISAFNMLFPYLIPKPISLEYKL